MYLRAIHEEKEIEALFALIREYPLGVLTTVALPQVQGQSQLDSPFPMIQSTHIPWTLDTADGQEGDGKGRLCGHMARANPHVKQLIGLGSLPSAQVTVLFTHAVQSYISPRYYTETKPKTAKVVPTWNYAAVEVRGTLRLHDSSSVFLDEQVRRLTQENEPKSIGEKLAGAHEAKQGKDHAGWNVSDAPDAYLDVMKKAIIGVEIEIESIVGKFKMSQELSQGDRDGVIAGFKALEAREAEQIANLVEQRGSKKGQAV